MTGASGAQAGGLIGYANSSYGQITSSYSTGAVSGSGAQYLGGFVGLDSANAISDA